VFFKKVKGILKMLKLFLFLNDIMKVILGIIKQRNDLPSEIFSRLNFIIGIFTLEPKYIAYLLF